MDSKRFDAVTRTLGDGFTRRGALGVLAGIAALGLSEGLAKRKHRGNGQRQHRGKRSGRKQEAGTEKASPGKSACRPAGHPCEGNQECCNPGNTICVPSGPGAANRCTRCPDGEIACANICIPACTALDQCHDPGVCDPATGQCTNPPRKNGTSCNDHDACTQTDTCQNGVCVGGDPVVCQAKDQCHVAGVCDSATGACSNPKAADGTNCTTANDTPGACLDGTCKEICLELGKLCGGSSPCCAGLDCDRTFILEADKCCTPTGGACGKDVDCTSQCETPCCGLEFVSPKGDKLFGQVSCVEGTCCNPAGHVCQSTADCCQSGPAPTECIGVFGPSHIGYCTAEALGLQARMCLQAAGTPCTNQCQCADGYCVNGLCSATCRAKGESCDSDSACCSIGSCTNGVCDCC